MNQLFENYYDLIREIIKTFKYDNLIKLTLVNKPCQEVAHTLLYQRYYIDLCNLNLSVNVNNHFEGLSDIARITFVSKLAQKIKNICCSGINKNYLSNLLKKHSHPPHKFSTLCTDLNFELQKFQRKSRLALSYVRTINGVSSESPNIGFNKLVLKECKIDKLTNILFARKLKIIKCSINSFEITPTFSHLVSINLQLYKTINFLNNKIDFRLLNLTKLKVCSWWWADNVDHRILLLCPKTLQYLSLKNLQLGDMDLSSTRINILKAYECIFQRLILSETITTIKFNYVDIVGQLNISLCPQLQRLIYNGWSTNYERTVVLNCHNNSLLEKLEVRANVKEVHLTSYVIGRLVSLKFDVSDCKIVVDGNNHLVETKEHNSMVIPKSLLDSSIIHSMEDIKKYSKPIGLLIDSWIVIPTILDVLEYKHALDFVHIEQKFCNKLTLASVDKLKLSYASYESKAFDNGNSGITDIIILNSVRNLDITIDSFLHNSNTIPKDTVVILKIALESRKDELDMIDKSSILGEFTRIKKLTINFILPFVCLSKNLRTLKLSNIKYSHYFASSWVLDLSPLVNLNKLIINQCNIQFPIKAPDNLKYFENRRSRFIKEGLDWSNVNLLRVSTDLLSLFSKIGSVKKYFYRHDLGNENEELDTFRSFVLPCVRPIFWRILALNFFAADGRCYCRYFYGDVLISDTYIY